MIIDTAEDVTAYLPALKAAGVTAIIRYLTTTKSAAKLIRPAEARAIAAAGMQLGLVFEVFGGTENFKHGDINAESGAEHAAFALWYAPTIGAPNDCGIYFAIDTDATADETERLVVPYFRAIKSTIAGKYRVGAYCSGSVADRLRALGLIELAWITCSSGFRGSRAYVAAGKQDLHQTKCDTKLEGIDLDVDLDVANAADWGQFLPFGAAPTPAQREPTAAAWPAGWGAQEGMATVYWDDTNADDTPVDNDTDMTCAMQNRTIPFGTRLRVTVTDTGASAEATVHDHGGPALVGARIIDCRPALADALGIGDRGVVPVRLELLDPAAPTKEDPMTTVPATTGPQDEFFRRLTEMLKNIPQQPPPPPPTPTLSPLDKILGGQSATGLKTIAGVLGMFGTLFGAHAAGADVTSLDSPASWIASAFALLTSAGFIAKIDRGIAIAQKIEAALKQIAASQQPLPPAAPQ